MSTDVILVLWKVCRAKVAQFFYKERRMSDFFEQSPQKGETTKEDKVSANEGGLVKAVVGLCPAPNEGGLGASSGGASPCPPIIFLTCFWDLFF